MTGGGRVSKGGRFPSYSWKPLRDQCPPSLPTTPCCLSLSACVALLFCPVPRLLLPPSTNSICKMVKSNTLYTLQLLSAKCKKGRDWKKLGCAGGVEQTVKNHFHFHSQPLKMKARTWSFPLGLCGWVWAHEAPPHLCFTQNQHLITDPGPGFSQPLLSLHL